MLGIILRIFLVIGWVLLGILGIVLFGVMLVLFWPVGYHVEWQKDSEAMKLAVRIRWFLGALQGEYRYPKPGAIVVKAFGRTVFDSGKKAKSGQKAADPTKEVQTAAGDDRASEAQNAVGADQVANDQPSTSDNPSAEEQQSPDEPKGFQRILYKVRSISDKIRKIITDIDYYLKLLREEDTKQLFAHVFKRVIKILKSICPRRIKGWIYFGTGSPDTTGYVMALYGMLSPHLGKNLTVSPDFEEKILEGELTVKGHLIIAVVAFHGLRAVLDRRLRVFIKKLKREENINGRKR